MDISNVLLVKHSSFLLLESSFQCLERDVISSLSSRYWTLSIS